MAAPDRSIAGAIEAGRRELTGLSATPALDARVLTGFALGLDASALVAYGENIVDSPHLQRLANMVARRKAGEPVAYIIGSKEFCGMRLAVDRRVLIPRPETELLVERVARDYRGGSPSILELGTGSGAIACALADALPDARILATDIDPDAMDVAAANVASFALGERIELAVGDLFAAVPEGRRFDVIVANLPYVGDNDDDILDPGARDHEPARALFGGGEQGLDVYRRMLEDAPGQMTPSGALYMECGPRNALELAALAKRAFPARDVNVVLDLGGKERMVVVR